MNELKVKKILKDVKFKEDDSLSDDLKYLSWDVSQTEATLDGDFTADELEAIAWWMRHKCIKL